MGRLSGESSQLRQDLLHEADARAALEKNYYQTGRQLEAQLAAAQFAREQATQRLALIEQENEGLRSKAASLLSVGQQCALGEYSGRPLGLDWLTMHRCIDLAVRHIIYGTAKRFDWAQVGPTATCR